MVSLEIDLHCGVSEANVSSLCCTCAESLVHNIHLCTDVWRGTQWFWSQVETNLFNVREPKKKKMKWKLTFKGAVKHYTPLISFPKQQSQDPEACYGFLTVGTYKATPNSIEKKPTTAHWVNWPWSCVFWKEAIVILWSWCLGKSLQPKFKKTFYQRSGKVSKVVHATNKVLTLLSLFSKLQVYTDEDSTRECHQKSWKVGW